MRLYIQNHYKQLLFYGMNLLWIFPYMIRHLDLINGFLCIGVLLFAYFTCIMGKYATNKMPKLLLQLFFFDVLVIIALNYSLLIDNANLSSNNPFIQGGVQTIRFFLLIFGIGSAIYLQNKEIKYKSFYFFTICLVIFHFIIGTALFNQIYLFDLAISGWTSPIYRACICLYFLWWFLSCISEYFSEEINTAYYLTIAMLIVISICTIVSPNFWGTLLLDSLDSIYKLLIYGFSWQAGFITLLFGVVGILLGIHLEGYNYFKEDDYYLSSNKTIFQTFYNLNTFSNEIPLFFIARMNTLFTFMICSFPLIVKFWIYYYSPYRWTVMIVYFWFTYGILKTETARKLISKGIKKNLTAYIAFLILICTSLYFLSRNVYLVTIVLIGLFIYHFSLNKEWVHISLWKLRDWIVTFVAIALVSCIMNFNIEKTIMIIIALLITVVTIYYYYTGGNILNNKLNYKLLLFISVIFCIVCIQCSNYHRPQIRTIVDEEKNAEIVLIRRNKRNVKSMKYYWYEMGKTVSTSKGNLHLEDNVLPINGRRLKILMKDQDGVLTEYQQWISPILYW